MTNSINSTNYYGSIKNPIVAREASEVLLPELAGIVSEYAAVKIFGPDQWSEYFGVDMAEKAAPLPPEFHAWWNGPDPLDPQKSVSETHLPPIYCPRFIRIKGIDVPYNLTLLDTLVQKPLKGNKCPAIRCDPWYTQFGGLFDRVPQSGKWLVMRKELTGRNKPLNEQLATLKEVGNDYQLPSVIDLTTVTLIHYIVTKECYLGIKNNSDKQSTLSRCVEKAQVHTSNGFVSSNICVGQFSPVPYVEKDNKSTPQGSDVMPAGLIFKLPKYITNRITQLLYGASGHFETSSPDVGVALIREFK